MSGFEDLLARLYAQAKRGDGGFTCEPVRDLTKIDLGNEFSMVVAVDSDGGIGSRANDLVKVPEYVLGRFAVRVPLMEILSCGAIPIAAFDMLTVPMDELGKEIIRGVRDELAEARLGADFPLSGSTEDNVPVRSTGVATAVLGLVHQDDFRPGSSRAGDRVLCVSLPKSAPDEEISLDDQQIVRVSHIAKLLRMEGVHDLLPVGSRGVSYEARELAGSAGLEFVATRDPRLDVDKSAGPSTCALLSVSAEESGSVARELSVPVTETGTLA